MDEKQAIQRLKKGDSSRLEFRVARHQVQAVRTAYLVTRDPGLAEDVVQEAFLRVYHSIHSFDESRPFEPWFLRSVMHAAVKMTQRSARQVDVGDDPDESLFAELISRMESVEEQVATLEVQNRREFNCPPVLSSSVFSLTTLVPFGRSDLWPAP